MKISTIGDLHLEHGALRFSTDDRLGDVLFLAGDIGDRQTFNKNKSFLKELSSRFDTVIAVKGNHECYYERLDLIDEQLYDFYNSVGINYLNRSWYKLNDGTIVIGATLWTNFNKGDPLAMYDGGRVMADYRVIRYDETRKITPYDTFLEHEKDIDYIKEISSKHDKVIVLTHHSPTYRIGKEIANRNPESKVVHSFSSDLEAFIKHRPQITHWCCGHVHSNGIHKIGKTKVISNSRGYPGEIFEFNNIEGMLKWL